jgi:hypothetical protein
MKKLLNTILSFWILITYVYLLVALVRWYNSLDKNKKRLCWSLFLFYITLLIFGSL